MVGQNRSQQPLQYTAAPRAKQRELAKNGPFLANLTAGLAHVPETLDASAVSPRLTLTC